MFAPNTNQQPSNRQYLTNTALRVIINTDMDIKEELENKFRNTTLRQLEALLLFASSPSVVVTTSEISQSTSTVDPQALAGLVSSLAKIKTSKGPLLLKIGRTSEEGSRWRINEQVISRKELSEILEKYALEKNGIERIDSG